MKHEITLKINGQTVTAEVDSRLLLVHFIREHLSMTGTHIGCDTSNCGACTILLNGKSVKSCTYLAVRADEPDAGAFLQLRGKILGECRSQQFHRSHFLR